MVMTSFILNSVLLGIGLAMDAFSVSIANGLNEPHMSRARACLIAGTYGFFQFLMPVVGWVCVHLLLQAFRAFEPFIPWIALGLLLWIGVNMIRESLGTGEREEDAGPAAAAGLTAAALLLQGVATSIDALSVGLAFARYSWAEALAASLIIAVVTFLICIGGLTAGKKIGERLAGKAGILGGCILIFIGIEIFIRGLLT